MHLSVKTIHLSRLVLLNIKECQYIQKISQFVRQLQNCCEAQDPFSTFTILMEYIHNTYKLGPRLLSKKDDFLWCTEMDVWAGGGCWGFNASEMVQHPVD